MTLYDYPLDPSPETFHILIAEDDDPLRDILAETLKNDQRVINTCKDGKEALQALGNAGFDVVITDLLMAGADGLRVLAEAKRKNSDCVVIIMTGYASLDSAIQAIRGGAYDYIRKPFKLDEMEILVKNAVEKVLLTRENKKLARELQKAREELKKMRVAWDKNLEEILEDITPPDTDLSEVNVTLKQVPPDFDFIKKDLRDKALEELDKLIRLKKEGSIDEGEFRFLKRVLMKKLSDSSSPP